jgi:Tfp pilus assembly protein PilV
MIFPKILIVYTANIILTSVEAFSHFVITACKIRNEKEEIERKEYHCGYHPLECKYSKYNVLVSALSSDSIEKNLYFVFL